ncbi:MAG TPA: SMC-Scp complex subunit ScpB [Propionibacteriaceae bacterium]|nr:SMC-Scp complex subunit ScpB [Propionibacteriaceae bacterium]
MSDIGAPIEAMLLMADAPLTAMEMAETLDVPTSEVDAALTALQDFYDHTGRGFELRQVAGGWRYYTRVEHATVLSRWVLEGQQSKLSQAALETLAVIAYTQPISRARISVVRGVNVDGVVRTLLARDLITEADHDAETGAQLFVTTDYFLERMGLASLGDLPPLAPHLPNASELEFELSQLAHTPQFASDADDHPADAPSGDNAPGEDDE